MPKLPSNRLVCCWSPEIVQPYIPILTRSAPLNFGKSSLIEWWYDGVCCESIDTLVFLDGSWYLCELGVMWREWFWFDFISSYICYKMVVICSKRCIISVTCSQSLLTFALDTIVSIGWMVLIPVDTIIFLEPFLCRKKIKNEKRNNHLWW